jgi:SAM-dependent methyltransferase
MNSFVDFKFRMRDVNYSFEEVKSLYLDETGKGFLDFRNHGSLGLGSFVDTIYDKKEYFDGEILSKNSGSINHDQDNNSLINLAEALGWEESLRKYYHNDGEAIIRNFSKNRLNWLSRIPHVAGGKNFALELGPGTGGVTRQLSKYYNVVALDRSESNCAFNAIYAEQAKASVLSVCKESPPLPFDDNQFELVVLIGSLEWLGFYGNQSDPRDIVSDYLQEIYRVLKPGGSIYIASENAHYIAYFSGLSEAHTMLSYVSLLSQDDADLLSRDLTSKSFRNPTFSPVELEKALLDIGFGVANSYWLHPDYSTPAYIIPLHISDRMMSFFIDQRLNPWDFRGEREFVHSFFSLLPKSLIKHFVEHYGVIASKPYTN